jgi:hypothetical protein
MYAWGPQVDFLLPTSRPPKGTALNLKAFAVGSGLGGFDVRHGGFAAAAV